MKPWFKYDETQGFKWSKNNLHAHSGIDLGVPWDTPVTAAIDGVISYARCRPWGFQVDIRGKLWSYTYVVTTLHLHRGLVKEGQKVTKGQILGYSGGDGRGPCATQMPKYSGGPHVHFELTYGSQGPYHGGPPYVFSASSHTVDPTALLEMLRGDQTYTEIVPSTNDANAPLPTFLSIFALPDATVQALDKIPGIDGAIYALHEAETFPGWKPASTVLGPANALDIFNGPKIAYWIVGNIIGNTKAATVRSLYLAMGIMLFLALFIAFARAQVSQELTDLGITGGEVVRAGAEVAAAGAL